MKGNEDKKKNITKQMKLCYDLYKQFKWLTNSYVLDFYTENNWEKLPACWQRDLENVDPLTLAKILDVKKPLETNTVFPLSLLAIRRFVQHFDVPREKQEFLPRRFNDKLEKLLWKHVKPKKRHEIQTLAHITYQNAEKTRCSHIVDVGSGLGHLCRTLAYGYGLKMCGVEAQKALGDTARELDQQFQSFSRKFPVEEQVPDNTPIHLNKRLEFDLQNNEFVEMIKKAFNYENERDDFTFGIVALHACGDLTSFLLRLFKTCENIRFINIVGCCYMKLSTPSISTDQTIYGYPLSNFGNEEQHDLTYNSREVACHAIENYIERLNCNQYWQLKIHSYRAVLEKLLRNNYPEYCQCALGNVKYTDNLSFHEYCQKALKKINVSFERNVTESNEVISDLQCWSKVVVFFSLRLFIAPIIETVILLDRYLYLLEFSNFCELVPAFDPKLSPRNHVICAIK